MNIAIQISGQYRGHDRCIDSISNFLRNYDYDVFYLLPIEDIGKKLHYKTVSVTYVKDAYRNRKST